MKLQLAIPRAPSNFPKLTFRKGEETSKGYKRGIYPRDKELIADYALLRFFFFLSLSLSIKKASLAPYSEKENSFPRPMLNFSRSVRKRDAFSTR